MPASTTIQSHSILKMHLVRTKICIKKIILSSSINQASIWINSLAFSTSFLVSQLYNIIWIGKQTLQNFQLWCISLTGYLRWAWHVCKVLGSKSKKIERTKLKNNICCLALLRISNASVSYSRNFKSAQIAVVSETSFPTATKILPILTKLHSWMCTY